MPLSRHECVARKDILSNRSRGILPRRFVRIVPNPKAVFSCWKEGGRSKTARLRSWPPERRSGCTSAEPYPPSGSGAFWPCDGFECNCLPCQSSVSPSLFRFVIAFSEDHIFTPIQVCQNELRENRRVIRRGMENTACNLHDDVITHSSSRSTPCSSPNDFSTSSAASL